MPALPVRPLTEVFGCDIPIILALDFGATLGWACRHADGNIAHGIAEFDDRGGVGYRWLRLRAWLSRFKETCGAPIHAVYYEEVRFSVARGKVGRDGHASRVYGGFEATATCWCEQHRVPYKGIPVATIKKYICHGWAKKPEIIEAVRALGYEPTDDNDADALALLHLGIERVDGSKS